MNEIFISYRRDDSRYVTAQLYNSLRAKLGYCHIFKDIESLNPGDKFPVVLREQVKQCQVMLVIIGPDWLNITDDAGNRRLDNPNDFVRIEVRAGLEKEKKVIPVLVKDAIMPRELELPDDLKALADAHALELDSRIHYESGLNKLIQVIQKNTGWLIPCAWRRIAVLLLLMLLITGGGVWWWLSQPANMGLPAQIARDTTEETAPRTETTVDEPTVEIRSSPTAELSPTLATSPTPSADGSSEMSAPVNTLADKSPSETPVRTRNPSQTPEMIVTTSSLHDESDTIGLPLGFSQRESSSDMGFEMVYYTPEGAVLLTPDSENVIEDFTHSIIELIPADTNFTITEVVFSIRSSSEGSFVDFVERIPPYCLNSVDDSCGRINAELYEANAKEIILLTTSVRIAEKPDPVYLEYALTLKDPTNSECYIIGTEAVDVFRGISRGNRGNLTPDEEYRVTGQNIDQSGHIWYRLHSEDFGIDFFQVIGITSEGDTLSGERFWVLADQVSIALDSDCDDVPVVFDSPVIR